MKPEDCLKAAIDALSLGHWDEASAYADVGLLSLTIGAIKGLLEIQGLLDASS